MRYHVRRSICLLLKQVYTSKLRHTLMNTVNKWKFLFMINDQCYLKFCNLCLAPLQQYFSFMGNLDMLPLIFLCNIFNIYLVDSHTENYQSVWSRAHYDLPINTETSILKDSTANGLTAMLVIMSVSTFKAVVILYISLRSVYQWKKTRVSRENYWSIVSHWQTFSS